MSFPELEGFIRGLPDTLDRQQVREIVERCGEDYVLAGFVVTQIWGHGNAGYGPFRVRRIIDTAGPDVAVERLRVSLRALTDGDLGDAFRAIVGRHGLKYLGPSFATKWMFFADPRQGAVVLDEYVQDWMSRHADVRLRLASASAAADYVTFDHIVGHWGEQLGIATADVELLIFEAMARERGSVWANPRFAT
jgi:hypothetical protein